MRRSEQRAATLALFRASGGLLETLDVLRLGVDPQVLLALRDEGTLIRLCRGLYRLAELPALVEPELIAAITRAPRGVICLHSALYLHGLEPRPHDIHLLLPRQIKAPTLSNLEIFRAQESLLIEGVESQLIDGHRVLMTGLERCVIDAFLFEYRLEPGYPQGLLDHYLRLPKGSPRRLQTIAKRCRLERLLAPFI